MKKSHIAPITVATCVALLGVRYAESCFYGVAIGIHFHNASPVNFGTPPARFSAPSYDDDWKQSEWRVSSLRLSYTNDDDVAARAKLRDRMLTKAVAAEHAGHLDEAINQYRLINKAGFGLAALCFQRVALLQVVGLHQPTGVVRRYMSATEPSATEHPLPEIASLPGFLKPFCLYEQASRSYDHKSIAQAASAYEKCATDYPHSVLADSALIMAARCGLNDSTAIDEEHRATNALATLMNNYPRSRFSASALGLLARTVFRKKQFAEAASLYEQQLGAQLGHTERLRAQWSLIECCEALNRPEVIVATWLHIYKESPTDLDALYAAGKARSLLTKMNGSDSDRFSALLKRNPDTFATYLQLRLEMTPTTAKDWKVLASNARAVVETGGSTSSNLLARLAQLYYLRDDLTEAQLFANKASAGSKYSSESWSIAQYLLASIEQRKGRWESAIAKYKDLAQAGPKNYIAVGAHEALALAYDRTGKLGSALDEYYWLQDWAKKSSNDAEFGTDIAYLVDAKMTPGQIESYLALHPASRNRRVLTNALGIRYLRLGRHEKAEQYFARIPASTRIELSRMGLDVNGGISNEGPVPDPMATARDLAHLSRAAEHAKTQDEKAAGLLTLANYFYDRRGLLLYDAPLWEGTRSYTIGYSWYAPTATPADGTALREHHYEHECLAHAYEICTQILEKYPHSPSAPQAGFRAATAAERLSNFNPWWRWEASRVDLLQKASTLMAKVARDYPTSKLNKDATKYAKVYAEERKEKIDQGLWGKSGNSYNPGG